MPGKRSLSNFWREALSDDRPPWHVLCLDGRVRRPLAVTALDLSRFPQRVVSAFTAGSDRHSSWQGVELGWLLRVAGTDPAARFVVFHAAGRRLCLPLQQVSNQNAILALRRGDRWLSLEDGGPCRLVLAGTRWRDFGGPIDHIEVSVERPMIAPTPRASGSYSSRASIRAA